MPAEREGDREIVLDASVAAKLFFDEAGSDAARRILKAGAPLLAPELLFIEMASLAVKRVRRGLSTREEAAAAVKAVRTLIDETAPMADLSDAAFDLAARHGVSAYDGAYLALAVLRDAVMLTADVRFARFVKYGARRRMLELRMLDGSRCRR